MRKLLILLGILTLIVPILFLGCEGDDGATGATGAAGPPGATGPPGAPGEDATAANNPESCSVCHNGSAEANGDTHQAYYDQLYQDGVIKVTGLNVEVSPDNTVVTTTFTMTQNDLPFNCEDADSIGIYHTTYVGPMWEQAARLALTPSSRSTPYTGTTTRAGNGSTGACTVTATYDAPIADFTGTNGLVVLYGRDEQVGTLPVRISQSKYPFAAILETGEFSVGDYTSAANVAGCEKCHTVPFLKHGYLYGQVAGDPDTQFYVCKACHLDNGNGGHFEWQLLISDPPLAAAYLAETTTPEQNDQIAAQYAYKTRLMNDVHMSHAMEFPYPQSMANCATCHEGKLGSVLTDANFAAETCKSCHAVSGPGSDKQAPSLEDIWAREGVASFHNIGMTCNICHSVAGGVKTFSQVHTGYNKDIWVNTTGTTYMKYSDIFTVTIDNASLSGNTLTIQFHATESPDIPGRAVTDIRPTVYVGLYGYDAKNFIGRIGATQVSAASGSWEYTANLTDWADEIAAGKGKKVEIAVLPKLGDVVGLEDSHSNGESDDTVLAVSASSRTFDLSSNAFVDNYFQDSSDVVKVENGCNNCHDALATTFHTYDKGRGGKITVCRMCHVPTSGAGHLEMQSRSIDSYVHAIHSFQAFDIGDIDFTDPVEAMHYEHHIEFVFPTLGITNCESCHNPGTYNVPDQTKSLPGVFSGADTVTTMNRNIGAVPSYIAGPASRACGSCHRAHLINEDSAGGLAAFNSHTKTFGYLVESGDVFEVIDAIMLII